MININIAWKINPDQNADENADSLLAFVSALEARGIAVNTVAQSTRSNASNGPSNVEKGHYETRYCEVRGLKRMKVPATWTGSREDYAKAQLDGELPTEDHEEDHEVDPFAS